MKTFEVKVLAKHIKKGKRLEIGLCALALAIEEATGGRCLVYGDDFALNGIRGLLPTSACEFRFNFDQCKKDVKPFTFTLEVPT